ncbi:hypothetical protein Hanom_Chr06g00576511 [Helianthus anomalus]
MTASVPVISHPFFASEFMVFRYPQIIVCYFFFFFLQIMCLLVCDRITGTQRIKIENLCVLFDN